MTSTKNSTPPVESKRCSSCESERPLDWFQSQVPGSHDLLDTTTKTCKQCREKKSASKQRIREAKAAAKTNEPRSIPDYQLAANNPTPHLLGRPSTSQNLSVASAQNVEFEKMQHSFQAIRVLGQDEIEAAADRLLELIGDESSDDQDEDLVCEDKGGDRGLEG